MIKKAIFIVLAVCLVSFSGVTTSSAEVTFKAGGLERVRYEYWKNIFDMNNDTLDNRGFFRFKTSLWGETDFTENLSLYARLTNEFKSYTYYAPSASKTWGKTTKGYPGDINEAVVDNLYIDWKNVMDAPVNLRLGRQDLTGYGEGFLIADGTPGDGSRTTYFNALKASWQIDESNDLDLILIQDPRTDVMLPIINEAGTPTNLTTSKETGAIVYLKNKAVERLNLEGYYIYKREGQEGAGYQAEKGIIHTVGSYAKYDMAPFTLRGQLAVQTGSYGTRDRQALGGYVFIDREFKDVRWTPVLSQGLVYLSGDDSAEGKDKSWDPLFSRYPWYSELYNLSYKSETGVLGYWTNLQMYRASLAVKPTSKTKLSLMYNYLRANEEIPSSTVFSGHGRERGHLPQVRLDYAFSPNVTSYVLGEYFIPGNVYRDSADEALFVRCELQVKF